ncbi:hypothetical protein [Streptomyces sp. NPDC057910]
MTSNLYHPSLTFLFQVVELEADSNTRNGTRSKTVVSEVRPGRTRCC